MIIEEYQKQTNFKVLMLSDNKELSASILNILDNNPVRSIKTNITDKDDLRILSKTTFELIILLFNSDIQKYIEIIRKIRNRKKYAVIPILIVAEYSDNLLTNLNLSASSPIDIIFTPVNENILLSKINLFFKLSFSEKRLSFADSELKQIKQELKDQNKQLKYLAMHDTLTSAPNRYFFEKTFIQIIKISKRYQRSFAILLIDIDNFKWINDKFGHNTGDEVIKATAEKLKSSIRESDILARFGGDEFAIILSEVKNSMNASFVAQKILKSFELPLRIKQKSINISLSIGITHYHPSTNKDNETLMEEADIAMYRAKNNGKNRYEYFAKPMKDQYDYQHTLNYELQSSIKRNEFHLNYQPIVNIKNNQIIGVESLIRWNNSILGNISPIDFIPVAEQTGLIYDIGLWALESSCQQLAVWKKLGFTDIFISVNISPKQLKNIRFGEDLSNITKKYGIVPENIELEITEKAFTGKMEKYITFLHDFKNRLSIDDFGAQYSSLSRLGKIPLITLKIDGSLIHGIKKFPRNKIILKHLFDLAKELSLKIIVEQVSTEEEVEFLKTFNCTYAQGYYYYKPMHSDAITDILIKNRKSIKE